MAIAQLEQAFRHRENLDGSWDSICLRCYATAAHTWNERVLDEAEQAHCCDEASWIFKEPAAGKVYPRRHDGRPAGLREPAAAVARR